MKTKKKKNIIRLVTEFAKLQLAGNIPFWGTYFGFAFLDQTFNMPSFWALAIPTVLSNILFFIVDDKWVFADDKKSRDSSDGVIKFITFTITSAVLLFTITYTLEQQFGITPYIGQFISGLFSTAWTFVGLKFWVFAPVRHHGLHIARSKAKRRRIKTA